MNTIVLTLFTIAIVAFVTIGLILAAHAIRTRVLGEEFTPGKDAMVSACGTCDAVAIALAPGGIDYVREAMTKHYRQHPEHGFPVEVIPPGWDR